MRRGLNPWLWAALAVALLACGGGSDGSADGRADVSDLADSADAASDVADDGPATPSRFDYGVPLSPSSPWPKFRRTARQDGRAPIPAAASERAPWRFPTGKGIFSSAVIDGEGTAYIGSASGVFHAIDRDGVERWSVTTGEIIDSAGLLDDKGRVYFGSGDGRLYARDAATGAEVWTYEADDPAETGAFIRWFEGNVALGPDGTLLVPNDNWRIYAIDRDAGTVRWAFTMPEQTWSLPAVDVATGALYVGNNNLLPILGDNVFAIDAAGGSLWSASTLGTIAASPLLTADGKLILGGFDGYVRAFDAADGTVLWSRGLRDHIYASPAELSTGVLIQPGADGTIWALDPDTGAPVWSFDTREPIRSSPAIDGNDRIYVGSGEGRLFVLEPDGRLRYAMRLIAGDRNDLNSSPALGPEAVVIAGESGEIFSVPYDYCLRPASASDGRCTLGPAEDLPSDGAFVLYTTHFGSPLDAPPERIDPHQPLAFSLYVRESGDTRLALIDAAALKVTITPEVDLLVDVSADRRFVSVVPSSGFATDAEGTVTLSVAGDYLVDPEREGLVMKGGSPGGSFSRSFAFKLTDPIAAEPLRVPAAAGDGATAFDLARLAAPLPTILPSYNQIGFDSLHYRIGVVAETGAGVLGWMVGRRFDPASGTVLSDPATRSTFPIRIRDAADGFTTFTSDGGFSLEAMGATLGFDRFWLAAAHPAVRPDALTATLSVVADCGGIVFFGPFLRNLGFCSPQTDQLVAFGAVEVRRAAEPLTGPGKRVGDVVFSRTAKGILASVTGSQLLRDAHSFGLLVVDDATGLPVPLDYGPDTTTEAASDGTLAAVRVDAGEVALPAALSVWLLVDAWPGASGKLGP
ncbi:MAG: PQQ-binding-like beta-propeller repeat protein [Myxococcota bacterium]